VNGGLSAAAPNLALDQLVAARRAIGQSIVHLGFGESRLPVFAGLVDQLTAGARRTAYGPIAGEPAALRDTIRAARAAGASCRRPTGGFYLYPDFEPVREQLAGRAGIDSVLLQHRHQPALRRDRRPALGGPARHRSTPRAPYRRCAHPNRGSIHPIVAPVWLAIRRA